MKHRTFLTMAAALCAVATAYADPPKGFEEFRQGLINDFDSFKNRILEHYGDFLAGEWHEYESLEAESKYGGQKPSDMPAAERLDVEAGEDMPKEMLSFFNYENKETFDAGKRIEPGMLGWLRSSRSLYNLALPYEEKGNAECEDTGPAASGAGMEIVTGDGLVNEYDGEVFDFYGMKFGLPHTEFTIAPSIKSTIEFSYQWNELVKQNVSEKVLPGVEALQKSCGISDYLVYEMLIAWLEHKFPQSDDASRMSATHYLLTHMGFGVRIAMDDNLNPYMLIPFSEKIFGRSPIKLSKVYYVFSTPGKEHVKRMGLSSPYLPDNADQGKSLNLRMKGLSLPFKPFHYSYEYGGLKLEGDMNESVIPMLYRYPQMDTGGFADCMISPEVRADVVRQLKEQLAGVDPLIAADRLLSMIQFAFPYATDDDFHGFEKPYFFEESLFYPKNDCEDRAVFYSYLLWNALGLENHLIAYPVHEATAIKAEKVWGGTSHYVENNAKYFISDPTFQGAPTGQCMSRFKDIKPIIDLAYE